MRASRRSPSNGLRKFSASFPTTLALLVDSYLLTSAHKASNPSNSLFVSTMFNAFPIAEQNQCMIKVCCNTLQLGTCPIFESKIQFSRCSLIPKSCLHLSDDFLHSYTLKSSCASYETPETSHAKQCFHHRSSLAGISSQTIQIRIVHRQLQMPLAPWPLLSLPA